MAEFYPLGYPVRVDTGVPAVLDAAACSWARWQPRFHQPPLQVSVEVCPGAAATAPPRFQADPCVIELFADASNRGTFCCGHRTAQLRITQGTLEQPEWFRYHFLEALTLTALDTVAFTPLHAACVARGGRGVLLCGSSGSGKSSLAYACARQGWTFISDDAVHVLHGGDGLVVGNPHRLYLRASAASLFPEIERLPSRLLPNGKRAVEISMNGAASAEAGACVFLSRKPDALAELRPSPAHLARAYFAAYISWGDPQSQHPAFDLALRHGCHELVYSRMDDALRLLEQLA